MGQAQTQQNQQQKSGPDAYAGSNKATDKQSGYGKNSGKQNDNLTRADNKNDPLTGPNAVKSRQAH